MEHERILYILDYLNRYTNKNKGVTIKDIQNHLAEVSNMKNVSPLTIRRDIERLECSGNEFIVEYGAHNTAYYKIKNKRFTFNEIRFIVDSISINRFLTTTQKQQLIKKFEGLCSESEVRQLISRVALNEKEGYSMNLLNNLDEVHQIISEKRKINFEYGKYDVNRNVNYYSKRREIVPYQVVYFNERFYLRCFNEETQSNRTYRIDRMRKISAGEKTKIKVNIPKHDGVILDMFEPERFEIVTLHVRRFLLDDMLEQFGKHCSSRDDFENPDYVILKVNIGISSGFYRWLMRYGEDIEVISPKYVREVFVDKLNKVCRIYK